jgi:hypothetical protein
MSAFPAHSNVVLLFTICFGIGDVTVQRKCEVYEQEIYLSSFRTHSNVDLRTQVKCRPLIYNTICLAATAMNQYRKLETNIPRKGIVRPQSQFPHSCVCERYIQYIYSHDRSAFLLQEICGPILGIYKSLTDTWMSEIGTEAAQFPENEYINRKFVAVAAEGKGFVTSPFNGSVWSIWTGNLSGLLPHIPVCRRRLSFLQHFRRRIGNGVNESLFTVRQKCLECVPKVCMNSFLWRLLFNL